MITTFATCNTTRQVGNLQSILMFNVCSFLIISKLHMISYFHVNDIKKSTNPVT